MDSLIWEIDANSAESIVNAVSVGNNGGTAVPVVSRASTKTRINSAGLIEVVPANTILRDYDPVTLGVKGFLLEPQRTNLCIRSDAHDNAAWVPGGLGVGLAPTVTANYSISPDGTLNAERVQLNLNGGSSTADHSQLVQTYTGYTSGLPYAYATWLKSNDGSTFQMALTNFNTQSSLITVTPLWQRFIHIVTPGSTVSSTFGVRLRGGFGMPDTADISIYGSQLEQAESASSYIPTVASAVVRNADYAGVATANILGWVANVGGGYVEFQRADLINDGISRNYMLYDTTNRLFYTNANDLNFYDGVTVRTYGNVASYAIHKAACGFSGSTVSSSLNGGAVLSSAFDGTFTGATLQLGQNSLTAPNAYLRKGRLFSKRPTDPELVAMST